MCISLWNVPDSPWVWDILWVALEKRSMHVPKNSAYICVWVALKSVGWFVNWIGNPEITHKIQLFLKSGKCLATETLQGSSELSSSYPSGFHTAWGRVTQDLLQKAFEPVFPVSMCPVFSSTPHRKDHSERSEDLAQGSVVLYGVTEIPPGL